VRAYALAEDEGIPFSTAVSTVVLDRMLDAATFLVFAALTLPFAPFPPHVTEALVILAVVITVVFALICWGYRTRPGFSALQLARLLVPCIGISFVSWMLRFVFVWTMFKAFDLSLPLVASAVLQVVINVGIAVVGTPGNIGSFELACMGELAALPRSRRCRVQLRRRAARDRGRARRRARPRHDVGEAQSNPLVAAQGRHRIDTRRARRRTSAATTATSAIRPPRARG
jgi:uncharacterized membrane protein YbhN (UPF0104 family)